MSRWCEENGATLWITTTGLLDTPVLSDEKPTLAFLYEAKDFFDQLRVPFVDIGPYIYELMETNRERYSLEEGHPNELWAPLVADHVFEKLLRSQLATYCRTSTHHACHAESI